TGASPRRRTTGCSSGGPRNDRARGGAAHRARGVWRVAASRSTGTIPYNRAAMEEGPMRASTATIEGPPERGGARPRLAFVGPLQGAVHPGVVVTQGVRLSRAFREAGYPVTAVSTSLNRYARLLDIASTLLLRGGRLDI